MSTAHSITGTEQYSVQYYWSLIYYRLADTKNYREIAGKTLPHRGALDTPTCKKDKRRNMMKRTELIESK